MHETMLQLKTWKIMLNANATNNLFNIMKGAINTNSLVLPDLQLNLRVRRQRQSIYALGHLKNLKFIRTRSQPLNIHFTT